MEVDADFVKMIGEALEIKWTAHLERELRIHFCIYVLFVLLLFF